MSRAPDGFADKILSGFAWEGTAKLAIQVISWVTTVFVARILEPDDYGVVAVSGVFVGLLHILGDFGLSQGLINKTSVSHEEEDTVFTLSAILTSVGLAILLLAAPHIESAFAMERLVM